MLKINKYNCPRKNNTALAVLSAACTSLLPGVFVLQAGQWLDI